MNVGYFQRVAGLTSTRFWINNPTLEEVDKALETGAIGCTTNPTYSAKMLNSPTETVNTMKILDKILDTTEDDNKAAVLLQRRLVEKLAEKFRALFERKPGIEGFVSIQGDPHAEEDAENIIKEAVEDVKLGQNIIAKIPVTASGLKAIEHLVGLDVPILATEVMGISQAIAVCEAYERASAKTGKKPPIYVTHITGIFDDYMKQVVECNGINISKDILWQAGCAVARRQYRILKEKGYPVIMLGGGARGLHHFTEMVGGDMHVTINWQGTADKLVETDPPVVHRMDTPVPEYVINELLEKIPDFRKAYMEDGLKIEEFMDYGPVTLFRNIFLKGWDDMLNVIKERRSKKNFEG